MFKRDLEVIDELRREAVNVREAHPSGIHKLTKYAAQLVWMGGKFPIDVGWHSLLGGVDDADLLDWCRVFVVSCPGV